MGNRNHGLQQLANGSLFPHPHSRHAPVRCRAEHPKASLSVVSSVRESILGICNGRTESGGH
jgi:hypothetical protein